MAKAEKVVKAVKARMVEVSPPRAWIESGGEVVRDAPPELTKAVLEAWRIKCDIEAREADYKAWCDEIKTLIGAPATVVVEGVCRAIYAHTTRVTVAKPETLEAVLGGRYLDLVKIEEKVTPSDALIEMAVSADEPLAPALRAALKIAQGESFRMLAEKPAKEAA